MADAPRVTVFMPVHNRPAFIVTAIESVLAQTFADFELLVIDDGSTDETPEVLAKFADPRIRVVRNDKNLGVPATRNRGLDLARGEFLAMLDSDDVASPVRLERQVAYLDEHPEIAAVGSWALRLDNDGRRRQVLRRPLTWQRLRSRLLFMGTLRTPSVMGRTEVLAHYRFRPEYPVCSDSDYWVRVALGHQCANLPETLIDYRMHERSITRENRELVADRKQAVVAYQLDLLGVPYDQVDLDRHLQLRKPKAKQGYASCDLVAWVQDWLPRLLDANQRVQLYPEPYFSRAVGECWYQFWRWDMETGRIGNVRLLDPAVRSATLQYLTREWILRLRYGDGVA